MREAVAAIQRRRRENRVLLGLIILGFVVLGGMSGLSRPLVWACVSVYTALNVAAWVWVKPWRG